MPRVHAPGTFDNGLEAAHAYNVKARELFGDDAKLNVVGAPGRLEAAGVATHRGVLRRYGKWYASIRHAGRLIHIGELHLRARAS